MPTVANLRRDRVLFFTGLVLLLVGGPGFVVGSFLHDSLSVPLIGEAYDAFGWVNLTFVGLGIALAFVGIVLTALGLRGGVLSEAEASELEEEGSGT